MDAKTLRHKLPLKIPETKNPLSRKSRLSAVCCVDSTASKASRASENPMPRALDATGKFEAGSSPG